jgi:hypothetical protein
MKVEREDGLYRRHRRQNHKGGVELRDTWYEAEIEDYPQAEQDEVQVNKAHASGKTGDRFGDALFERRGDLLAVSSHPLQR